MAGNLKGKALSYGTYGSGIFMSDAIASSTEKVVDNARALAPHIDPTNNFILRWFPEAVEKGDLVLFSGTLYYQGFSILFISSVILGALSIVGVVARLYYDLSVRRKDSELRELALEEQRRSDSDLLAWLDDDKPKKK